KPSSTHHQLLNLTRQQLYWVGSRGLEEENEVKEREFLPSMRETSRHMFIFNTKLCQSEKLAQVAALYYDPNTVSAVSAHQMRVVELLKLFYCSKVPEEKKRAKIMQALEATKQELLSFQENSFSRAYSGGSAKALYVPIIEMIDIAKANNNRMKLFVMDLRAKMKRSAHTRSTHLSK
ncbi:hypothetical protein IE077_002587, partial [Cardiosporidium cionae]